MAGDPQTYAALIASLANWINRTDLTTTEIPEAISIVERRFNRTLRVPEMEEVSQATVVGGTITLPTDFLQARAVYLNTEPKIALEQVPPSFLRVNYATTATGIPQYYALQSGNEMVFGPSPAEDYPIILNYYAKIPALSEAQPTNWLLLAHPDLYLWGALAELSNLMKDEARADRFESKLTGRVAELNKQAIGKAYGASPLRMRTTHPSI